MDWEKEYPQKVSKDVFWKCIEEQNLELSVDDDEFQLWSDQITGLNFALWSKAESHFYGTSEVFALHEWCFKKLSDS